MEKHILDTYIGQDLYDLEGDKIGTVKDLYLDDSGEEPTWITVSSGIFGTKQHFVPITGLTPHKDGLMAPYAKDIITSAPHVDNDEVLGESDESELSRHYHGAVATEGHDTSGPTTDNAMTRSEEELHVGTEKVETGRVRLRKYIVTENVQTTVPVQREEVRIVREPITDENVDAALDGPAISEEEHEVVLHEERPVVSKEVVAKERVHLGTETVTEQAEVNEAVQKEVIEEA